MSGFAPAALEEGHEAKTAWPAVISIALGVFAMATAEFLPASLLTPIASDFAVSIGTAGQAVTVTAAVAAVAGPVLVLGAGRFDRRTIVLAVTALIVLSDLVAASASHFWVFLAGRVALGISLAGIASFAAALCMRLVSTAYFSRAMAIVFTGMTLATILAPPLGVYVGGIWGWRATFLLAAGMGAFAVVVQIVTLPRMPASAASDRAMFSRVLRRRGIVPALGAGMLIITGHAAGFTYVRPFLERIARMGADTISLIFLVLGIAGFVGNLMAGIIAERNARLSTGIAAFTIALATSALLMFVQSPAIVFAAAALWGIGFGITPISVQTLTVQNAPDLAEGVGALTMSGFQVAMAVGAIGGGTMVDRFGPMGAIAFCAASAFLGGSLALSLVRGAPRVASASQENAGIPGRELRR